MDDMDNSMFLLRFLFFFPLCPFLFSSPGIGSLLFSLREWWERERLKSLDYHHQVDTVVLCTNTTLLIGGVLEVKGKEGRKEGGVGRRSS